MSRSSDRERKSCKPDVRGMFSPDSDEDYGRPKRGKPVQINVNRWGAGPNPSYDSDGRVLGGSADKEEEPVTVKVPAEGVPDGYTDVEITRASGIKPNTLVCYETNAGKIIRPKYFKKIDTIANTIVVGFFPHNKRNYSESLDKIKRLFVQQVSSVSENDLKETIELPRDQWRSIRRDMVISYEKSNKEFVRKARFNSFLKGADGSSRMSLTSERGFNYIANPDNIDKIYRHITTHDKTLTLLLEALRKLDLRVQGLESVIKKSQRDALHPRR